MDLRRADLSEADLSGADLSKAYFSETILSDVDLGGCKNLDAIQHFSPSPIDMPRLNENHFSTRRRQCGSNP